MNFEEACCEVDYILEHMYPEDKNKIPESTIQFFKNNKSLTYRVNFNPQERLENQNLKEETKAFLKILYIKYFATKAEKAKFNYMYFQEKNEADEIKNTELIVKEKNNAWKTILKFIKKILHI